MEIKESVQSGATVLACTGRLDMVSAPDVRAAVQRSVAAGRARIVVDLAGVTFIDSSGLGMLVSGLKTARQASGDLRIAAAGQQVRTVLDLTNLSRILRPYATVEEAMAGW